MKIKQGDIYLTSLNPIKGHEQGGYRPVLVIQRDLANKCLDTVIIVPLTSNLNAKNKIGTFFISKKVSGLDFDSIALVFQVRTLDKKRLTKLITNIPKQYFIQAINNLFNLF